MVKLLETNEIYATQTWIDAAAIDAMDCGILDLFLDFLAVLLVELQEQGFWNQQTMNFEKVNVYAGSGGDMTFVLLNAFRDAVFFLKSSQLTELTPGQEKVLRRKGICPESLLLALRVRRDLVDLIGCGEQMSETTRPASETAEQLFALRAVMVRALTETSENLYPNQHAQEWKLCQQGYYYADGTERGVTHPWHLHGTMKMPFFIGLLSTYGDFVWACSATLEELQAIRLELDPDGMDNRNLEYDIGFDAVVDDTFIEFVDGSSKTCKVAVTSVGAVQAFAKFLARELLAKQGWQDGKYYVIDYGPFKAMGTNLREHLSKNVLTSLAKCSWAIQDSRRYDDVDVLAKEIAPKLCQAVDGPVTCFRQLTSELLESLVT